MLQSKIFVGMVLILIFAEVLGLYGYGGPVLMLAFPDDALADTGQSHRCSDNEHPHELRIYRIFVGMRV